MLVQPLWLTGLLSIASATPHAVPPIGLQPRYYPLGTAISLSTTTSPTPPPTPTPSSAAPTPTSSPSNFHLQASGDSPYFNNYYLTIGQQARGVSHGDLQVMSFIPSLPPDDPDVPALSLATFHLAANNTLVVSALGGGDGKSFARDMNDYWFFNAGPILETDEVYESVCEIVAGELKCVTGQDTVFYVCVEVFETGPFAGHPINDRDLLPLLGREVDVSCSGVPLTVMVVPV